MQPLKLLVCVKGRNLKKISLITSVNYVHEQFMEQLISQKELKLLNLMSICDRYSHTLTTPFLSSV